MHIEAELDDIHSQQLTLLQQQLQKPLPEVLATVIEWATNYQRQYNAPLAAANTESERLVALAYLQTIKIDWGGKPIKDRDSFYDDARG